MLCEVEGAETVKPRNNGSRSTMDRERPHTAFCEVIWQRRTEQIQGVLEVLQILWGTEDVPRGDVSWEGKPVADASLS